MLIESKKGRYKLDSNYRDAFSLEAFESKYIEECFDRYTYIVGDISSGILRLKGFDTNPQSKNYYGFIEDYLTFSCPMGCPYFILKRIQSDGEFIKEQNKNSKVKSDGFTITPLVKESFDRDNIVLEFSKRVKPEIIIDSSKINVIPQCSIPDEIREFINQDNMNIKANNKKEEKVEQNTQSYVSSSPGFVPNQNNNRRFGGNKNHKKKKQEN